MTQEDKYLKLAREIVEAWKKEWITNSSHSIGKNVICLEGYYPDLVPLFAAALRKERDDERVRCAKIVENWLKKDKGLLICKSNLKEIATAIKRGES